MHTYKLSFYLFSIVLIPIFGCSEPTDLFENINKLRTIGTKTEPVTTAPSTLTAPKITTLTFFAALPKNQEVKAEVFTDGDSKYAAPIPITLVPGSEAYEEHASFRIFSVQATANIPTQDLLVFPPDQNFVRFRYGMVLRAQADEERIIGNIVVYKDGSEELNWTAPNLTLENPIQGATLSGKQPIKLSIESSNDENFRVSWLVNDGKVKNRRGLETEWEPGGAGEYTMIASARGLKSGGFQFKAVDFKVD
jgi:hypothetical protein